MANKVSRSTRWAIAVVAVVLGLIVGLAVELRHGGPASGPPASTSPTAAGPAADTNLADLRKRADLPPCPAGPDDSGPSTLRGVMVECAADGVPVDAAAMLGKHRVVLNLWAYWCVPCRTELPSMAEYQRRAGSGAMVVTVHQDENEAAALALLGQLGVRLPTMQDGLRRVAAALRVPNVMPATVVLTPDGSVARILPQAFANAEEIAEAVHGRGR